MVVVLNSLLIMIMMNFTRNKMKRLIFFILCLVLVVGCNGEDIEGDDQREPDKIKDDDTVATGITNPSGRVEAASCLGYNFVFLTPYNPQFKQTGKRFLGETSSNNRGDYLIRGDVVGATHGQYDFEGHCRRETAPGTVDVKMRLITALNTSEKHINFPGTIQSFVAINHFDDPSHVNFGNINESMATAKTEVIDFFDMPDITKEFSETSIQGGSTSNAVMTMISATIDYEKSEGWEQTNFIKQIAEGILDNDLTLKAEVNAITESLPIYAIMQNIQSIFDEVDITADPAPIHELPGVPDYYADIINNEHVVLESWNIEAAGSCNIDVADYNSFAYPIVFSNIEAAKYYASELSGDISLWTVSDCNNGAQTFYCPGTKLLDIEELREVLLLGNLSFNGLLGNHSLISGQYFIVQNFEENTAPGHVCAGEMNDFGTALAAHNNDWVNAVGYNNSHAFFNRQPQGKTFN
jgi:hypothetical protein